MKYVHWIFCAALLTSSFDIFLVIDIGGSLRFSQVLLMLLCLAGLAMAVQQKTILWPKGMTALTLWCLIQALFLPLSVYIPTGIQFFLLLMLTVLGVLAAVQLYGRSRYVESLMRFYLGSFVLVAIFGLYQFFAPLLFHIHPPLVAMWWLYGRLARINGFSYEPSFFATYLIMGWIAMIDLRLSKAKIMTGGKGTWALWFVTLALFLATSKTAWIFMILEAAVRSAVKLYQVNKILVFKLSLGNLRFRPPLGGILIASVSLILMIVAVRALTPLLDWNMFISGTGLNNTATHSVDDRTQLFDRTKEVFLEHPFIGRSLGGVSGRIAERAGAVASDKANVRFYQGFPVFMEVLVSSGVVGVIPFVIFLFEITFGQILLIRSKWSDERAKWLQALVRAMIYECLVLTKDENLLRVYVWFHVTMIMVVSFNLRYVGRLRERPQSTIEGAKLA